MDYNEKDFEECKLDYDIESFKKYPHHLTVGKLLKYIKDNDIPEDAVICTQRVFDYYYKNCNWSTIKRYNEVDGNSEYTPASSIVRYKDQDKEDNVLLIDLHI